MKGIEGRLFLTPKGYDEAGDLGTPYKAQKCGYCGHLPHVRPHHLCRDKA